MPEENQQPSSPPDCPYPAMCPPAALISEQLKQVRDDFRGSIEMLHGDLGSMRDKVDQDMELTTRTWQKLEEIERDLLGNGQPGRVQRIETDVAFLRTQLNKQRARLDWKAGWANALIAFLVYIIAGAVRALGFFGK